MFSMYLHGPLQLLILDGVIQCLKKEHGISCVSHQSRVCLWRYLLLHTLSVFLEILSLLGCPGEAFPSEQDGCCPAGPLFFFLCAILGIGLDTAAAKASGSQPCSGA